MSKRIKVADLPEFDAAHYRESETSIALYLTDILDANEQLYWLPHWAILLALEG